MRKQARKLSLHRETLHQLNAAKLVLAGGRPDVQGPPETAPGAGTGPIPSGPFYSGCPSAADWCTFSCGDTDCC